MFGATFTWLDYGSRTIIIFGTVKDDRLTNTGALNNCLYHRNVFQNDINAFSKMVNHFLSKSSNFAQILLKFHQDVSKYLSNNVRKDFRLSTSVSNGNIKCPIEKSNMTLKLFRATVTNTDTGILKSLFTIFDTYLDYLLTKFEANRMDRNVQNVELFGRK